MNRRRILGCLTAGTASLLAFRRGPFHEEARADKLPAPGETQCVIRTFYTKLDGTRGYVEYEFPLGRVDFTVNREPPHWVLSGEGDGYPIRLEVKT